MQSVGFKVGRLIAGRQCSPPRQLAILSLTTTPLAAEHGKNREKLSGLTVTISRNAGAADPARVLF